MAVVLERTTVGAIGFLVVGAVVWQWFNASLMGAANSIVDAGGMLRQIYLPKAVLPLISILFNTWKFLFLFVILLLFLWFTGHLPSVTYAALPVLLVLQLVAIVGFTLPLALVMPYFPDARVTVEAILRSGMLISGIFFSVDKLPVEYRFYFHLNPLADLIEAYRAVLLDSKWPDWNLVVYVGGLSFLSLVLALVMHRMVDRSMVKAIHR